MAPTHLRWNPLSGVTDVDWLWAVSNTPYGPYSSAFLLDQRAKTDACLCYSFVQRDAAHRNQIYSSIQSLLDDTRSAFSNLSSLMQGELRHTYPKVGRRLIHENLHDPYLSSSPGFWRHTLVLQSLWTKLKDQLNHAATYVSILDFSHAMEYVEQARAAADSLIAEVRKISSQMKPFVTCSSR